MAKNLIDIEDIPPQLANKVKQDLRLDGEFCVARAVQYSAGPAYGEQGYDVCDEFAEPEAAILYPL